MPPPCGLVASPLSILITVSYNKQYLTPIILSFPIRLLSSPIPNTEPSLIQLQQPHLLPLHPHLQLPPNSSNKSDDSLTDHSFYKSETDSEPTKERRINKSKAAKEPTSSSGKKKDTSKQASNNPSPPPHDGYSPSLIQPPG
ncbi:hypothetical protein DSO57_1018705 [Entomophthora muscae]|uniref:Uncharacterized protein n=1 Tax=Entomophthora muscae TaxID=34485 RepID=A0ACC2UEA6_9FUNG|nr:hypothetical protein DSO57_1018705 [Entomophthora muscae]